MWALQGIDPWGWSAARFLHVVAYILSQGEDDPLRKERVEADLSPDGFADWGKVTPEEARRIMVEEG